MNDLAGQVQRIGESVGLILLDAVATANGGKFLERDLRFGAPASSRGNSRARAG
jgi:hypothetical protein